MRRGQGQLLSFAFMPHAHAGNPSAVPLIRTVCVGLWQAGCKLLCYWVACGIAVTALQSVCHRLSLHVMSALVSTVSVRQCRPHSIRLTLQARSATSTVCQATNWHPSDCHVCYACTPYLTARSSTMSKACMCSICHGSAECPYPQGLGPSRDQMHLTCYL